MMNCPFPAANSYSPRSEKVGREKSHSSDIQLVRRKARTPGYQILPQPSPALPTAVCLPTPAWTLFPILVP